MLPQASSPNNTTPYFLSGSGIFPPPSSLPSPQISPQLPQSSPPFPSGSTTQTTYEVTINRSLRRLSSQSFSPAVRLQNEFIREKVLLKRYWIQLWAHLKGVPFDLMYDSGLSHIAGQIGDPKETDDWTLSLMSISAVHVKVEIDTTIPLPSQVEVGRSNGTFVTVEVEYPWVPPSCAH
ncbi:hypothetical protein DY000_02037317 [Brassica cretica]|uniref:Uncharacterized protein n=1 Tax=Brassica cretica TaxID=69181 RepID=A0ABQ7BGB0_BRACR|nr:hypothetical protein DY000_02037317 [Brassica cretica]